MKEPDPETSPRTPIWTPRVTDLNWKVGFEVELLAPRGLSRRDLADAIARDLGGRAPRCFHPQTEPSAVPGKPVFHNLTLGFDVHDGSERLVARCVDDLTLQADLDRGARPLPGWHRIVSDDPRLLSLVMAQCDAQAARETVLAPIARLFGTALTHEDADVIRLADRLSEPIRWR
jgi:hypothetical protein